jgi:HEAT repeat protein
MRTGLQKFSVAGISLLMLVCVLSCDARAEEDTKPSGSPQSLSELGKNKTKIKNDADANLSSDELHDKQMKMLKEAQEKAIKKAEDQAKKGKKKDKEAEKKEDPTAPKAIAKKGAKLVEVEPPKDGKKKGTAEVVKSAPTASNVIEVGAPKDVKSRGNTAYVGTTTSETALQNGDINKMNIKDPPGEKRGFFDRLFGKDKKPTPPPVLQAAGKGEDFKLVTDPHKKNAPMDPTKFMPAQSDHRDTLSHKVQEQMAIKRLEGEQKEREKSDAANPSEKRAEVVEISDAKAATFELDPEPAKAEAKAEGAGAVETSAKAPTEEEIKAAMEQQYRTGLGSRDVVAREAAFQRAAMERREDAIPYLLEELKADNLLAVYAAQCLGAIGKLTDDVEVLLIRNLASHRPANRQVCAENLGRLQSRRAVPPLIESFKVEKSYQVRQAELDALGAIGERSSIPFLKLVLEQKDEIETVKSRAALALARMGDPTGRAHLIRNLDSPMPALQVLGIIGLSQLREPFIAAYLNKALESQYEEVWTTAVYHFPLIGPAQALPVLRTRLDSPNDTLRRRAALAMGFLGSDEAVPYIDRALRLGSVDERVMGCELIGNLQRKDRVPLLIERLQDPNTNVRQTAAVALTRLNAVEAIPALTGAVTGLRNHDLPADLRQRPEMLEKLVMLSCVRILRGEKDDLVLTTLPNSHDGTWPEFDRVLSTQQKDLVKLFGLVDVIAADGHAIGAVLKTPDGKEIMFKEGEPVASGFKVREIGMPLPGKDKNSKLPPYVILMRGDDRITLTAGKPAEEDSIKTEKKK